MRLGSLTGDCPPTVKTITNWQKVSTALEEIDTPMLNNIPNDIVSTDDIDNAIGALTNHIRTVVDDSSRTVPANSDRKELPRDVKELIRAKNAALRRASKYPTCENRSEARILQRKVRDRVREVRNENWSDLMEGGGGGSSQSLPPPKDDLDPITHDEVSKHIKALKIRKAPGADSISSKALKCFLHHSPNHSCPQQALRLVEYISEGFKVKRKTVAVFFDVAKAFDRTNKSWSTSRLHALLYSAYVNDIPRPKTGVQLALFADDTALFLRSNCLRNILPRLQRAIDELTQWLRLWRIEVNPEKSASIYFDYSPRKSTITVPLNTPYLRIQNQPIPWQKHYKYLGITLDRHLHFRDHIARAGHDIRESSFAHARPDILYDLQVVQNKFCRRAADAPWVGTNPIITTVKGHQSGALLAPRSPLETYSPYSLKRVQRRGAQRKKYKTLISCRGRRDRHLVRGKVQLFKLTTCNVLTRNHRRLDNEVSASSRGHSPGRAIGGATGGRDLRRSGFMGYPSDIK
ncbi:RNA-directed DNA polymerase from mobile element jockey [Eumeta japonica]|uniref:RNA-directed DNA polymerase from mobile element jockey n=1 Tax=Eumeta variegata TaxID=151549 RepID=A0A4C1W0N7_EUMVA|nr:RNA-directed DNA polymerase from mobile element jockey [Eumeta japonica]